MECNPPENFVLILDEHNQPPTLIAELIGRLGAVWAEPAAWSENEMFRRYFEHRLNRVSRRNGIRR